MAMTYERAAELFRYDPDTGDLIRIQRRSPNAEIGMTAGTPDKCGYIQIQVDGRLYKAHRIAFLLQTGAWPVSAIDHIDGNPANNKWKNLRPATGSENCRNARLRKDNTSGYKGVCRSRGRWLAQMQINGRCKNLGLFDDPAEAHRAYLAAVEAVQPGFGRSK